jgi:putative transposase
MREVCADFEADLKQFNGEQDHVHLSCTTRPKSSSPNWSTPSRASAPADSARSTTATSAGTCGADTSGPAPTSQDPATAPLTTVKQYIENQQRPT